MVLYSFVLPKLLLIGALLLPGAGCQVRPMETVGPAPVESYKTGQDELLNHINEVRTRGCRCGRRSYPAAPPLRWNEKLETAARRHARDMSRNDFFDHRGSDGSDIGDRISAAGYRWGAVAENIAWGDLTPETVIEGWFDSPGHCRNLMNPDYEETGVAWEGKYWVQKLGSRLP